MISLNVLFYIFIALFAVIGMIRGFRKEIIVTVSGILSLFIIAAVLPKILEGMDGTKEFYFNILILLPVHSLVIRPPQLPEDHCSFRTREHARSLAGRHLWRAEWLHLLQLCLVLHG